MNLSSEQRREMVDERVCRIIAALMRPEDDLSEEAVINNHLADEWACLEIAARTIAPCYGVEATDANIERLQRAAHDAIKATCEAIAAGR